MRIGVAEIVLVAVLALVLLAGVPFVLAVWVRRMKATARVDALALGVPRLIDPSANCVGLTSKGPTQVRPGNGCLSATETELVFVQWAPRKTLRIPRAAITKVGRVTTHLGKRGLHPFLEVTWSDAEGGDTAAWWVRELTAWERELGA